MEVFRVQLLLVRRHTHCVAIKNMLAKTPGIKLRFDADIFKRQTRQMTYYLDVDGTVLGIEEFSGRYTPSIVLRPIYQRIEALMQKMEVQEYHYEWGAHIPPLGLTPIAYIIWVDAGMTIYIKK